MAGPRIAFYAVNGLGLGHVTRLLGIARALRRQAPAAEILFITSSEADGVIYREGFAAVKLPSKSIRETCGLGKSTYLRMAQSVTWSALSSFNPDVLVVDTFPAGSFDELLPVLGWRQRNVFVYREQRAASSQSGLLAATLPLYDLVIVPHHGLDAVSPLPEPDKARAVGPILVRERDELRPRAEARAALGLPPDRFVIYGSFGGGGDAEAAASFALLARAAAELPHVSLAFGGGPLLRAALPAAAGLTSLEARYPMLEMMPAFDAAIAAAGYNTAHELLFAGIPSALVPFGRVLDDQDARARGLAANGACLLCAPLTEATARDSLARLADPLVRERLAQRARSAVPRNGAGEAARHILDLA